MEKSKQILYLEYLSGLFNFSMLMAMFTAMGYNNYTSGAGKYSDVSMEGAANRLYQLDYGIKFQGLTTAGLLMWHFSMVYKAIQKYADENSASKLLQHTLFITIMLLQCAVMWGNTAYDIDVLKKEAAEDNHSTGGGLGQLTTDTGLCPDTTTGKGCAFELCTTDAGKIYYRLFEVNSDIVTPVDATVAFASLLFLVHLVQTVLLWQWEKEFGAYDTLSNQSNQPSNVGTGGGGSGDSYQQL